jgi:hypothetical protein
MRRRDFLRGAGAAATACLAPGWTWADASAVPATLTIDESAATVTVPREFVGLSYESAQLAAPEFFSDRNSGLVELVRGLGDEGVLRLGGATSEFTAFTREEPSGPPPFDAVGPDTSKNAKTDTPVTPKSLRNLRRFLDETGWRCLYGLNLGRGTRDNAAEEALYAQDILGDRLIAFQLGNEPDAWRNRYRPSTWSYEDYWKEWLAAHSAIAARVLQARFAGPDVSNKMAYVTDFAQDVKGMSDVVMLTSHYYAMGPAGAKNATRETLLSPDPKLARDLAIAIDAARSGGLPYRMSEGNSCWNGGQPGVSDTLASALWVADVMLQFAQGGCAGVNLHGGGNGFYTPIAGSLAAGLAPRPEYWGMCMVRQIVGATLLSCSLHCDSDRVHAYAARLDSDLLVLAINKSPEPVVIETSLRGRATVQWLLNGPAIDARKAVRLEKSAPRAWRNGALRLDPYSANLVRLSRRTG